MSNAGFGYLEVKCLGCNTHQTVALYNGLLNMSPVAEYVVPKPQ
jgi:hypothetical protein